MKKRNKKIILGIAIVLTILFSYVYIFWGVRPFDAEITQDRPLIKKLCEMQIACHSFTGPYNCSEDPKSNWNRRLSRWKGFKGCNANTRGFQREDGSILVEYCSCGGLM